VIIEITSIFKFLRILYIFAKLISK